MSTEIYSQFTPRHLKLERKRAKVAQQLRVHLEGVDLATHMHDVVYSAIRIVELALYTTKEKRGCMKKRIILDHFKQQNPQIQESIVSGMIDSLCQHLEPPTFYLRLRKYIAKVFPRAV